MGLSINEETRRQPDLGQYFWWDRQGKKLTRQVQVGKVRGVDELVVWCGSWKQEGTRSGPGFKLVWLMGADGGPPLWWDLRRKVTAYPPLLAPGKERQDRAGLLLLLSLSRLPLAEMQPRAAPGVPGIPSQLKLLLPLHCGCRGGHFALPTGWLPCRACPLATTGLYLTNTFLSLKHGVLTPDFTGDIWMKLLDTATLFFFNISFGNNFKLTEKLQG